MSLNLAVEIAGMKMKNPVTTASGTFGSGMEYDHFVDISKLGAVTTKGVANVPWPGNPTPRIAETYGGMLNAIGLQNPGIDVFIERDIPYLKERNATIPRITEDAVFIPARKVTRNKKIATRAKNPAATPTKILTFFLSISFRTPI